jgi:hypothetical protein
MMDRDAKRAFRLNLIVYHIEEILKYSEITVYYRIKLGTLREIILEEISEKPTRASLEPLPEDRV